MQQIERIELIKAAVELTKIATQHKVNNLEAVTASFDIFYDYLQLKLEASNNAKNNQ